MYSASLLACIKPLIQSLSRTKLFVCFQGEKGVPFQVKCRGGVAYSVESNQSISCEQGYAGQAAEPRPSVSGRPMFGLQSAANFGPSVSGFSAFDTLDDFNGIGSWFSELHTATVADLSPSGLAALPEPQLFQPAFDFNNQKFGDKMSHQLMIPKDHLDGIAPLKITDDSKDFKELHRALGSMKDEKQVLILIDTDNIYGFAFQNLRKQLEHGSFIEHHRHKQDEIAAAAWASDLQKPNTMKDPNQKKYLIGDWFATAGFEAPAVIFITKYDDSANNATFCQRAKAKLVIYHVPKVKIYHYDESIHCSYMMPPSDSNCNNCGEIKPGGTYSTCFKDKVWTTNDIQENIEKGELVKKKVKRLKDYSNIILFQVHNLLKNKLKECVKGFGPRSQISKIS